MPNHDYFMGFARHAATASKDSTKVGAALVGPDGEVRLTSYNGPPRGVRDLPERFVRPEKYLWVAHAESNICSFAARSGIATLGCDIYVTHMACNDCTKLLIQAGVRRLFYGNGKTHMDPEIFEVSKVMMKEAKIECVEVL